MKLFLHIEQEVSSKYDSWVEGNNWDESYSLPGFLSGKTFWIMDSE